jgi:energy-coupling factor transporter ATP-binding protein EcfA2
MLVSLDATEPTKWMATIERLCADLRHPLHAAEPHPFCPYPGMIPFQAENAHVFYGREAEIQQMIQRLRHNNWLFIIGPSGSGKSSLVNAGLLPRLQTSKLFPKDFWLVRKLRLGTQPIQALQEVIGNDLSNLEHAITTLLTDNSQKKRLLLIIDQFEELFTTSERDVQSHLIKLLLEVGQTGNCLLLIVLRADFYTDLLCSDLWSVASGQRLEVTPLRGHALRDAIIRPAESVKVHLDPVLVERIQADAADEPGILPMIQETMVLLWDKMMRRFIPLHAYEQLGSEGYSGLQVAMAIKADAVLASLTPKQQIIARRIFLRLIQFGEGRRNTRRQQSVSALRYKNDESMLFEQTLQHLTNHRLLTLSGDEKGSDKKVDIAHEALIIGWPKLQIWLTEWQKAEQKRRLLEMKATEWEESAIGPLSKLLDPQGLREALTWLDTQDAKELGYSDTLLNFVEASKETTYTKLLDNIKKENPYKCFCTLCGVGFSTDNVYQCTKCSQYICFRCVWIFKRLENRHWQCPCGGELL